MDDTSNIIREGCRVDFETESRSLYTLYVDERHADLVAVRLLRYSLETRAGPFPHLADFAISGYTDELPRVGAAFEVARNWRRTGAFCTSSVVSVGQRHER